MGDVVALCWYLCVSSYLCVNVRACVCACVCVCARTCAFVYAVYLAYTLSMISVTLWLFAIGAFLIDTTTIDAFFCFLSTDSADKHCCAFDRKHEYNDHNDHDKR